MDLNLREMWKGDKPSGVYIFVMFMAKFYRNRFMKVVQRNSF